MAPSQTLKWVESGKNPSEENVEIEGTEPYIVGGHTASGYWVDSYRETTIKDLFAAGDVAGGCPQKYVTGALVEGEIAANRALEKLQEAKVTINKSEEEEILNNAKSNVEKILNTENPVYSTEELEEAMQKIMDEYAGGIKSNYGYSEKKLDIADYKINQIIKLADNLGANDMQELMYVYELKERLVVCKTLIAHLKARKETRWHSFAENLDYPEKSDKYLKYVNSKYENGKIKIIYRDLVGRGEVYEHSN